MTNSISIRSASPSPPEHRRGATGAGDAHEPPATALDAGRLWQAVRRRWWVPVVATGVVAGGAWAWVHAQAQRWQATSVVQVYGGRRATTAGLTGTEPGGTPADPSIRSQVAIARSRGVLGAVVDAHPLGTRVVVDGLPGARVQLEAAPAAAARGEVALALDSTGWRLAGATSAPVPYGVRGVAGALALRLGAPPADVDAATLRVRDRDGAIDALASSLVVTPREQTTLIDLAVATTDPVTAILLANAVAREYQAADARVARQQVQRRRDFIEAQLRETNAELARAEAAQSSFRGRTQSYTTQEKFTGKRAELATLETRRAELDAERRLVADLVPRLEAGDPRAYRMLPSTPLGATAAVSALYAQLVARESARQELVSGPRGLAYGSAEVQRADTLIQATRQQLASAAQAHLEVLGARLAALDEQRTRGEDVLRAVPVTEAEETQLAQGVQVLREQAAQLRTELQKARIAEAAEPGQVEIVDAATRAIPLVVPFGRVVVIAIALGLLLGIGGVLALDALDATVRARDDLEQRLRLPVIGTVPRIMPPPAARRRPATALALGATREARREVALAVAHDLRSSSAEAFRQLGTNLLFAASRAPLRTLMITSPGEDEGKTSVAVSLAVSLGQKRLNVLLVDCDLVKSRLGAIFGQGEGPGLREVLAGDVPPLEAVRATGLAGVSVLAAGRGDADELLLVARDRLQAALAVLAAHFDVIVLDSAPILAVADTLHVGVAADGVLLVTRVGRTRRDAAAEALRHLDGVGANVVGAVLNDPDEHLRRRGAVPYAYGYRYARVGA